MILDAALLDALRKAHHVVVFTGAGVSAESGIPTFRDRLTGLWERFDAASLATAEAFRADPALVWGWYEWRRSVVRRAQPNPAHLAIAALAGKGQSGRIYDITGREALTLDQVMGLLSQANGRPIRVDHVSPEELRRRLEQQGEEIGPVYAAFQEGILHGKYDRESGDFQELTGKLPDTLAHFFEHNRVTDEQMQVKYRYADHPE